VAKDERNRIRDLVMESARVQVATLNAGIAFWKAWTDVAASYAQVMSKELLAATEPDTDTDAQVGRMTDSAREYLRKMTELPRAAVGAFERELQQQPGQRTATRTRARPPRAARAKE